LFDTVNDSKVHAELNTVSGFQQDGYDTQQTKVQKAEYALKIIGREATTRELINTLLARDPELLKKDGSSFDKYQKALAATLVQKVAANKSFYSIKTNDGVKYGLIIWRIK
jgi:hypothetical protein